MKGWTHMGMAASQARFLSLTARKTNTEFQGQQINQQRTTLSNESSNEYAKLNSLTVPTPPSSTDYTKVTYTFNDGSEDNTISSIIAKTDGNYLISYIRSYQTESMVSNGSVITTRCNNGTEDSPNYSYKIGATTLRTLGDSSSVSSDPYLKTLSAEDLKQTLELEDVYKQILQNKFSDGDWYVRYQLDSSSNTYTPVFYNAKEVQNASYSDNGTSINGVKSYVHGETTETNEVKNVNATFSKDTKGRYISVYIYDKDGESGQEYSLTTNTEEDTAAYNDAMNKYNYEKSQYDQEVQAINANIEIIQGQDKSLELQLKQLDTEQSAISTEMDSIKKVISKNIEKTFNVFDA